MELIKLSNEAEARIKRARDFAIERHNQTGCDYSGYSYDLHLKAVANVGRHYLHLLNENEREIALQAIWLHDSCEDCRVNYNDLKEQFGETVSDIVYNVTNELGKNRKERALKTYPKIRSCRLSTWVKICDRISNMRFSYFVWDEKGMFRKYQREHADFFKELHQEDHGFDEMWAELQVLSIK